MSPSAEHEQGTIRAFVQRAKQDRFLGFIKSPKNRRKFTRALAHFRWFDQGCATPIPWEVDPTLPIRERAAQGIDNMVRLLKSRGAGPTCWVISEDSSIDGQEMELRSALEKVSGKGMGSILSCVPGKLAYYEKRG